MAKYTHKSGIATQEMFNVAKDLNVDCTKLDNPGKTRWHSQLSCMQSMLKNKIVLFSLADREDLEFGNLMPTHEQWAVIEGACTVLEPFRELGKIWEAEKIPTLNRVVEGLYVKLEELKSWYKNPSRKKRGVMFCLLYTSPRPRARPRARLPSSA